MQCSYVQLQVFLHPLMHVHAHVHVHVHVVIAMYSFKSLPAEFQL